MNDERTRMEMAGWSDSQRLSRHDTADSLTQQFAGMRPMDTDDFDDEGWQPAAMCRFTPGLGQQLKADTPRTYKETIYLQDDSEHLADGENPRCLDTTDLQEAAEILSKKGMVVLSGFPGSGKTTLGNALLRRWVKEGFTGCILGRLEDWYTHVDWRGTDLKYCVLMDGLVGEIHEDDRRQREWKHITLTLLDLVASGRCKLVVTVSPPMLRQHKLRKYCLNSPLLDKACVLRLMRRPLDASTKEKLLKFHVKSLMLGRFQMRDMINTVLQKDVSGPAFLWCCRHLVQHWRTSADPTNVFASPGEAYVPMFRDWLLGFQDGSCSVVALLALTMKGVGLFRQTPTRAQRELDRLQVDGTSLDRLAELADILQGSVLSKSEEAFSSRSLYEAAGLTLGRSSHFRLLMKVCDVDFLVQYVRTILVEPGMSEDVQPGLYAAVASITDDSLARQGDSVNAKQDLQYLVERMFLEITEGRELAKLSQHPSLQCPEFLDELENYCKGSKNLIQRLARAADKEHHLPLLYWSTLNTSLVLTSWCLRMRIEAGDDLNLLPRVLLARAIFHQGEQGVDPEFQRLAFTYFNPRNLQDLDSRMSLCLPTQEDCLTRETRKLLSRISAIESDQLDWFYLRNRTLRVPATVVSLMTSDNNLNVYVNDKQDWYILLRLLTDRRLDETDPDGNSLLHVAADMGNLEAAKVAVKSGASLTLRNKEGLTPYQLAQRRRQTAVRRPRKHDRDQDMLAAIRDGDEVSVKTFLCHSCGVDDRLKNGKTGLVMACEHGHDHIAAILVELGANVQPNALSVARRKGLTRTMELLRSRPEDNNFPELFEPPLPPHFPMPFECDYPPGREGVIRLLLDSGADVSVQSTAGDTPLHDASRQGHSDIVELLLQHGALVNDQNCEGNTPLHLASSQGHRSTIEILIRHGADVTIRNFTHDTPLHVACSQGHTDVADLLICHGADVNGQDGLDPQ